MNQSKRKAIRLVLVGIEGEINLGFIARLAKNFDVNEVYLVSPKASPLSEEAKLFAAKAKDVLEKMRIVRELEEALAGTDISVCTTAKLGYKSDVVRNVMTLDEALPIIDSYRKIAIVFGRESVGLTREELSKCDVAVTIPASPEYPVLNVSHAVAIILYSLWNRKVESFYPIASGEEIKRLRKLSEEIVDKLIKDQRKEQAKAALAHCFAKARLFKGEAATIYYFLKKLRSLIERCAEN